MNGWGIVSILCCSINAAALVSSGNGITSPQFWISLACTIFMYIAGRNR